MEKYIVVAEVKNREGEQQKVKRMCERYTLADKITPELIVHANAGIKLVHQRQIRDAYYTKNGMKKTSAGGRKVNLDDIESV